MRRKPTKVQRPTKAQKAKTADDKAKSDVILDGIITATRRVAWQKALACLFACRQGTVAHISKLDDHTPAERKMMGLGAAMLLSAFDVATVNQRMSDAP